MDIEETREKILIQQEEKVNRFFEENSVSIFDYRDFICHFPYKKQAFQILRKNWKSTHSRYLIRFFSIYGDRDMVRLNREKLFETVESRKEFIFKVLLWGYPTKGRGNNIDKILEADNLDKLRVIVDKYKNNNISTEELEKDISEINGLGISTMSKFLYFLNAKIDGFKALILDDQIMSVINEKRIIELNDLSKFLRSNAVKKYSQYLEKMERLSKEMECEPDQIEIFLYSFGKNIS
ncbi:hypothetical protein BPO_1968 [Bergeyella porcorum]|uniref:DNA-3-methyladenine glycosylase 2 family protein n=1 Tax=Bergeyella porcorum TaxID=1735111 RepID=A0AAU0F5J0_9FLAO